MKTTVLLVYPLVEYGNNYPWTWVPYSLLAIDAAIKKDISDIDVILFDQNHSSIDEFYSIVNENMHSLLLAGFSIMTGGGQIKNALSLAQWLKEHSPKSNIVFGGPHVNVLPEQTLMHPLIDDVLSGPGQISFPLYIKYLNGKITPQQVPGLISKRNAQFLYSSPNLLCKEAMIKYDFDALDLTPYIRADPAISSRILNYISSQGCPHQCAFCYESSYRRKYFSLNEEDIIDNISYLVDMYGINGIKLSDADWFINMKTASRIMESMHDMGLAWAASAHPKDLLRNCEYIKDIAKRGCTRILMGLESGNDRILNEVIYKGVKKDQVFELCKRIADAGIMGSYTFVVGFPGEKDSEIEDTFDLIERLWDLTPRPETKVHIYYPYPGTPLFETACSLGYQPYEKLEDWSEVNYYTSQTPWVSPGLEERTKKHTDMMFLKGKG